MRALRREDAQVTVMAAFMMIALLGVAGLVLDVGSWFRQQRVSQATVDAAALAAAQDLPNASTATTTALNFAAKNDGVAGVNVVVKTTWTPNDTVVVTRSKPALGIFGKLFGVSSVTVHAKATAVAEPPTKVDGAAPIVINKLHPMLAGPGCPCFNVPTTLPLGKTGAPGAFALIDLDYTDTQGTVGASTIADWINKGFDGYLPIGIYYSDPGAKWNNSIIQNAIISRYGTDMLFPVYDTLVGSGSNAEYHVFGWASFHLTNVTASGTDGSISGYFTKVVWQGVVNPGGPFNPNIPDLGVHSVALID
jgi:hypothetical protein